MILVSASPLFEDGRTGDGDSVAVESIDEAVPMLMDAYQLVGEVIDNDRVVAIDVTLEPDTPAE